ncbi:helix-turn-helix domain-containing protein [Gryllotalpicola koreensis]|uniref:HTH cro/C1-type domain-containing protein n=1 Tax=Gryllotalpicola koreensis TaxID=993086 RepID=A0ABP8A0W5_9MICO
MALRAPDEPTSPVGAAVRAERRRLRWSMRELARTVGTSQPFVSNVENGRIFPSVEMLLRLSAALGVSPRTLLPVSEHTVVVRAAEGARRRRAKAEAPARVVLPAVRRLSSERVELTAGEVEPVVRMHAGEDFVYAVSGDVEVLRESLPPARLAPGDAMWLDGALPHRLACPADAGQAAVALIVSAAPGTAPETAPERLSGRLEEKAESGGLQAQLGASLRRARTERGFSSRALARLAGISQSFLSNIENGRTTPSVPTLYTLAEALGVAPAELLPKASAPGEELPADRVLPFAAASATDEPGAAEPPVLLHLLAAARGRAIEAYRIVQQPGFVDERAYGHPGEDLIYVVAGRVSLVRRDAVFELRDGDVAWLDATTEHAFTTPQDSGVTALLIGIR